MPAFPSDEEIRDAGARIAERALERAAQVLSSLREAAHDYFPDHDGYDWNQLAVRFVDELKAHAQLVYQRRLRMEATGSMCSPGRDRHLETPGPDPDWLKPSEVGAIFRVDPRTIVRWCKAGLLKRGTEWIVTAGGHHRISAPAVGRLISEQPAEIRDAINASRPEV